MTEQVLTVSCKLQVEPEMAQKIDATLASFADCCNWINQTVDPKVTGRLAIHKDVYHLAKQSFGLPANLVCQAILRVASNRKTAKANKRPVKKFKPTSAGYDARIFTFREDAWAVRLTLLNNRHQFPLLIGNYQRHLLSGENPTSATLIKRPDGDYYIQMHVKPKPPEHKSVDKFLSVDLGRRDIAYTSTGDSWDAEPINRIRDRYTKLRQDLQKKASVGTRFSRRRCRRLLQRLSGNERRFQALLNHTISYRIVQKAKFLQQGIAIEDLTGIREKTNTKPRTKTERRKSNSWSFYQLRQFLNYKCLRFGVKLVLVNPAYTSQTCHSCLHIGQRSEKSFKCGYCGWHGDSDFNAANVISLLGATINSPGGSYLSCAVSWIGLPVQLNLFDWGAGLLKTSSMPQAWAG
jgi:IS605 OrfB family transposase